MKKFDRVISIREVQHFTYCPRRWGLIYLDDCWSENVFVNKAKIVHENVDKQSSLSLRGKYVERAVQVYNDEWNLFGVLDCLQLTPSAHGVYIEKYGKRFRLTIVEYKPTKPQSEHAVKADRLQLLAQKICIDKMFQCDCETCFYFADTKKRQVEIFCDKEYRELKEALNDIMCAYNAEKIPNAVKGKYCNGCSIKDICLPRSEN